MGYGKVFEDLFDLENLYIGIGGISDFIDSSEAEETIDQEEIWNELITIKKLVKSNTSIVILRKDWKKGEIYNEGDYVLTDDFNIYQVEEANGNSFYKPTSDHYEPIKTRDNYVWSHIETMTDEDRLRFLTDTFMPIKNINVYDVEDKYLCIYSWLNSDENNRIAINHTYKNVCVIVNPYILKGNNYFEFTGYLRDMTTTCKLEKSEEGDYRSGQNVFQETNGNLNYATVVDFDHINNTLRLTNFDDEFVSGKNIQTEESSGNLCIEVVKNPMYRMPASTHIVFLENHEPTMRTKDSRDEFRLILQY